VAYYRVSTDRQGESGLGLEAQRSAVARYVGTGYLAAEFTEIESGKKHTNRPQLLAAIAACKQKHATLLIAKLDRLARNVHFISGLMESSAEFVACDMPHANRLTIHILAAIAEHEREMISQRTKAAFAAAKAEIALNGFRISRRSGKPYSKHGNPRWRECIAKARAAKNPLSVAEHLVGMMRAQRAEGATLRAIAGRMNQLGLRTPSGHDWYASTVRQALKTA
jgi:DNA invertase Pin-like site-specific DNA recombinase